MGIFKSKTFFYILLFIGIFSIGVIAAVTTKRNLSNIEDEIIKVQSDIGIEEIQTIKEPEVTPIPSPTLLPVYETYESSTPEIVTISKPVDTQLEVVLPEPKKLSFIMPLNGEIIKGYSVDELVFSKTLQDYRQHHGIDIKANMSAAVKAVEDGTIEKAYEDDKLGFTILIDHGQGFKTQYSNLAGIDMVTIKKQVKKGDVIGSVGDSALFEIADVPHLHFEMLKDNKNIDPLTEIK